MRPSTLSSRARLSLAVVLAGFAVGATAQGHTEGDASVYVLMADSLWNDGDLVYEPEDYARAAALHFGNVPAGLILTRHDWGYGYGKSLVYPAIAAPFYGVLGPHGFFVLNGLLLAALVLLGADVLSHRIAWKPALGVAAAVIGLSVTPIYIDWIDPFLTCSVLAAAALAAYRRGLAASCGAVIVTLAACRPPYLVLAAAPAALYALDRDWRRLASFTVAALLGAALFVAAAVAGGEAWTPYAAKRFVYLDAFPYDGGDNGGKEEVGFPAGDIARERRLPELAELVDATKTFFVGRYAGVLIYFPGLLACALWIRGVDREKVVWGGALLATCGAIFVAFPQNYFGGVHAVGNRLFPLLPIAFVCVDFVAWRPWRVVATFALATLALPVVRAPVLLSHHPGQQIAWMPYRLLPMEWAYVRRMRLPFAYGGMAALTDNQYAWEGSGVWTRGVATAEFVFVRPPGVHPRVRLFSPLDDVRITDGASPVAWRPGSVDLALSHPVAAARDNVRKEGAAEVYVLRVTTGSAFQPRAHGGSSDNRYLGVFVQPLDRSPPPASAAAHLRKAWWTPPAS